MKKEEAQARSRNKHLSALVQVRLNRQGRGRPSHVYVAYKAIMDMIKNAPEKKVKRLDLAVELGMHQRWLDAAIHNLSSIGKVVWVQGESAVRLAPPSDDRALDPKKIDSWDGPIYVDPRQ